MIRFETKRLYEINVNISVKMLFLWVKCCEFFGRNAVNVDCDAVLVQGNNWGILGVKRVRKCEAYRWALL
jgi:hypothetical protein